MHVLKPKLSPIDIYLPWFFLYSGVNLTKFLPSLKREPKKIIEAGVYAGQREFMAGGDMDGETRYDDSWGWGRGVICQRL